MTAVWHGSGGIWRERRSEVRQTGKEETRRGGAVKEEEVADETRVSTAAGDRPSSVNKAGDDSHMKIIGPIGRRCRRGSRGRPDGEGQGLTVMAARSRAEHADRTRLARSRSLAISPRVAVTAHGAAWPCAAPGWAVATQPWPALIERLSTSNDTLERLSTSARLPRRASAKRLSTRAGLAALADWS